MECGGTKTIGLAADGSLREVGRFTTGPCNLRLVSDQALEARFREVQNALPTPVAVGVGMAGVRDAVDCARIERVLERVWPGVPRCVDHDLESALAAAELESDSRRAPAARVIVLSGTGSCCYGRNARGVTAKVGGWGHLLGDRGSAYDIAFRALRQTAHALDHTGHLGVFGRRALRLLALNEPNDWIAWLQAAGKTEVAALAPEVFAAAAEGDRVARRVVAETVELLAGDALACADRLAAGRERVGFVLTGSVLLKQAGLARALARRVRSVRPGAAVSPLARESVWGAVVMARRALGPGSVPSVAVASPPPPAAWEGIPRATALSPTEQRNPRSARLDRLSLNESIGLMLDEESRVPAAIRSAAPQVGRLIGKVVRALGSGGRLFYVGAGTSGRLGVLDASECPPTFQTPPEWVQGIMAGGERALHSAVEGAEDDLGAGARAVEFRSVGSRDVVLGIAASGRTPFVWGALAAARRRGAFTALLCFNPHLKFARGHRPDLVIAIDVGPEVLTGSTRLKAGTATKLVLNLVTTLAMVRLGKVAGNLMIDLNPSNVKLRDRACRIVMELTGWSLERAEAALQLAGWRVAAVVRSGRSGRRRTSRSA